MNGSSLHQFRLSGAAFTSACSSLLVMLFCVGCAGAPLAQSKATLGVVDPTRVLNETDAGKKVKTTISSFVKNRQALIEIEEKELKRMEDDLIKQASVLSATAKREREEQFRRKMLEYQQKAGEMNREIQEKQKEVLEGFRERIEQVVGKVAQEKGLLVVIEKGKGGPTVYNDGSLDITTLVIEEMQKGEH